MNTMTHRRIFTARALALATGVCAEVFVASPVIAAAPSSSQLQAPTDSTTLSSSSASSQDDVQAVEDPSVVEVHRYALLVGANDGGAERVKLQYAGADVDAFGKVLSDIGGVRGSDHHVLLEPTGEGLRSAFVEMESRIESARANGERVEFVFYFSGHSDETGLLLGEEMVDYVELRKLIHDVPADVSIGILDSCASGSFTRLKGGTRRAPFLVGAASVKGYAYLASSSADEAAQESDRVGGSFFTHYLVTGLRGAADVNEDKQVTLNEAYRFAFDETLQRTQWTEGGPQHAAYDIRLAGTGDLVMTDLRETSAQLAIAADVGGRVYVRDGGGNLVAELYKAEGAGPVFLAMEPGTYEITVDDGEDRWTATLSVTLDRRAELSKGGLKMVELEQTQQRGNTAPVTEVPVVTTPTPVLPEYEYIASAISFVPPMSTNEWAFQRGRKVRNHFGFNILYGRTHQLEGAQLGFGVNAVLEDASGGQLALGANYVGGELEGAQLALGANYVGGELGGAQLAVGYNQANHGEGAQLSVGANSIGGDFDGVQVAVGSNFSRGQMKGMQAAVGANISVGEMAGTQLSSGINISRQLDGVQAGLINIGGNVEGAQLGLLNVATGSVKGAQLGLLNYANEASASIGLLGITRKGGVYADVWTSDMAAINAAVRFRAKYTYTMLVGGVHPSGAGKGVMYGLGFGGHFPITQRAYLEVDGVSRVFHGDYKAAETSLIQSLRLIGGAKLTSRFKVWGGVTGNLIYPNYRRTRPGYQYVGYEMYAPYEQSPDPVTGTVQPLLRLWPGFVAGIEI